MSKASQTATTLQPVQRALPVSANPQPPVPEPQPEAHSAVELAPQLPAKRPPTRLAALDGLRFLAAASVLLFHYTARTSQAWDQPTQSIFGGIHEITRYGYLGVDLFFIISGFVILMTAWGNSLQKFVASRVARLFPAYWAGVILTGGMLLATGSLLKDISPIQLIVNLTMMHKAADVASVDGAYWTLWIELRFYAIIGIFMLLGITRNRVLAFSMFWPVLAMVAYSENVGGFGTLLLPRQAPLFALGMLLYLCFREGFDPLLGLAMATQLAFSLNYAYTDLNSIGESTGSSANGLVAAAIVLAAFGLIVAATFGPGRRISWAWLTTLGALTYPLYVLHEYWGWFIIRLVRDRVSSAVAVLLATAVSLAMAWLVLRLVERPLAPRLRRAVQRGLD